MMDQCQYPRSGRGRLMICPDNNRLQSRIHILAWMMKKGGPVFEISDKRLPDVREAGIQGSNFRMHRVCLYIEQVDMSFPSAHCPATFLNLNHQFLISVWWQRSYAGLKEFL